MVAIAAPPSTYEKGISVSSLLQFSPVQNFDLTTVYEIWLRSAFLQHIHNGINQV